MQMIITARDWKNWLRCPSYAQAAKGHKEAIQFNAFYKAMKADLPGRRLAQIKLII